MQGSDSADDGGNGREEMLLIQQHARSGKTQRLRMQAQPHVLTKMQAILGEVAKPVPRGFFGSAHTTAQQAEHSKVAAARKRERQNRRRGRSGR